MARISRLMVGLPSGDWRLLVYSDDFGLFVYFQSMLFNKFLGSSCRNISTLNHTVELNLSGHSASYTLLVTILYSNEKRTAP
jgi:hypothetical protein